MDVSLADDIQEEPDLPQCKIKRNYSCPRCSYFTQNPRFYLSHLRDEHGERININNCNLCLYASRHYQKLVRHMKMVHGSTTEGIPAGGQARKRLSMPVEDSLDNFVLPPLPPPSEWIRNIDNFSYDLKSSRKTLKDIAAIYFAENEVDEILAKMTASDVVEVVPPVVKESLGDFNPIGYFDLDIICDNCDFVSKSYVDSMMHARSCPLGNFQSEPLDLSMKTSDFSPKSKKIDKEDPNVSAQEDLIKELVKKCENILKTTNEDVGPAKINLKEVNEELPIPTPEQRKVFKCPHCPFVALTASRFHIHIVGHQNKKPFKCSLCVYCSNWRWDITKHIRMRTLRSPSHRSARVLMQNVDIVGRCDYKKYDKYITIMDLPQHDEGDTPSPCCEEAKLNDKGNIDAVNVNMIEHDANSVKVEKEEPEAYPMYEQTQKGQLKGTSPRAFLVFEDGEKPTYKCSKCSFRHVNRDAVLVHVKVHHDDLLQMSKSVINDDKPHDINSEEVCINDTTKKTAKDVELIEIDVENVETSTVDKDPPKQIEETPLERNTFVSSESFSSENDLKTIPSFRCWHCHQVSNWKHVIQRHCRLKHSGSVRIEFFDRSIETKNPMYRLINEIGIQIDTGIKNKTRNEIKTEENAISVIDVKQEAVENEELSSKIANKSPLKVKQVRKKIDLSKQSGGKKVKPSNSTTDISERSSTDITTKEIINTVKITSKKATETPGLEPKEVQETQEVIEAKNLNQKTDTSPSNSVVDAKPERATEMSPPNTKNNEVPKVTSDNIKRLSKSLPEVSPRKTIFVNFKTGQIIKKN